MRMIGLLSVATSLILAGPADAQERPDRGHGYFFNRPGANLQAMRSDLEGCEALARGTTNRFIPGVPNPIGIATSIFLSQISAGRQRRVNRENCMVIAGWRLFAFTRTEGRTWRELSDEAREAELATLVGVDSPGRGVMIREWNNDYAEPTID